MSWTRRRVLSRALPGLVALAGACKRQATKPASSTAALGSELPARSIALVSYSLALMHGEVRSSWDGKSSSVEWVPTPIDAKLRAAADPYLTRLRHHAEINLNQLWPALPSRDFVATLAYQERQTLAPPRLTPLVDGYGMRMFGESTPKRSAKGEEELQYEARLRPETAAALAAMLGTDLVAVVGVESRTFAGNPLVWRGARWATRVSLHIYDAEGRMRLDESTTSSWELAQAAMFQLIVVQAEDALEKILSSL